MVYHIKCGGSGCSRGAGPSEWLYTTKDDLLHWLTRSIQQWLAVCWRGWKFRRIVYLFCDDVGSPSHLNLVLKAWKMFREQTVFSLYVCREVVTDVNKSYIHPGTVTIITRRQGRKESNSAFTLSFFIDSRPLEGAAHSLGGSCSSCASWNVLMF